MGVYHKSSQALVFNGQISKLLGRRRGTFRPHSPQTRAKLRAAQIGRKVSLETLADGDLARQEGVTSGEREETTVTLDSRPPQEIGSSAVGGAVGAALRIDRCPCGVRAV